MNRLHLSNCYKILPTIYSEALSYYEQLCKITYAVNELAQEVEELDIDSILKNVDVRIQSNLDLVYKQMDNLNTAMNNLGLSVTATLEKFNQDMILKFENFSGNLTAKTNQQINALRNYIDSQNRYVLNELYFEIEELKASLPTFVTVYVKSPLTRKIITIQEAINEIWDNLKPYALTAYEYDSLRLTATEYDNKNLSAFDYDFYAKNYIYKNPDYYMFSPFTGEYTSIKNIIVDLANLHKTESLTAQEYDELNYDCDMYDGLNLTAYSYDWKGKELIQ